MRTTVPVIDLAPFLAGGANGQQAVARAIGRACEGIGFFTIVGHGVDARLVRTMYDVSRAFFDLPVDEKQRVGPRRSDIKHRQTKTGARHQDKCF